MKKYLLTLLLAYSCFGGQSLRVSTQNASNSSISTFAPNGIVRLEFQVVLPASAASPNIAYFWPAGLFIQQYGTNLQIYDDNKTWGCCYNIDTTKFTGGWLNIRFQIAPGTSGTGLLEWEAWDINGILQVTHSVAYTNSFTSHAGGPAQVQCDGTNNCDWGFYRVYDTNIPMGSKPPLFSDTGDILEWRFNNSLTDNSGHSYTATMSSGSPTYVSTTGQTFVSAIINSTLAANSPGYQSQYPGYGMVSWDSSGHVTNYLDCTNSYTQSDAGGQPSCAWSKLSGPALTITSASSTTTTVTSVVDTTIGGTDYDIQLIATDSAMNSATATMHIGAVAMSALGIVTPVNSNASIFFKSLIAFGKNPLGAADLIQFNALSQRTITYNTPEPYNTGSIGNPIWDTPQTGTVSYIWNGTGSNIGGTGTTLNGGITATATSIVVTDATKLDLSSFPTHIMISTGTSGDLHFEEVCIGSAAGNTLTVCYDGRGVDYSGISNQHAALGAQSWLNGASVGQQQVKGSGTSFLSTICPGGAGVAGPIIYSTGTVTVTHNSSAIVGNSTVWSNANGVYSLDVGNGIGQIIQINATHASGTSFVFDAIINNLNSTTSITASRIYPNDADDGTFSYTIIKPFYRQIAPHFTRPSPYSGDAITDFSSTYCVSNTLTFFNAGVGGHDNIMNGVSVSGANYSYIDATGYINQSSTFGANGYGEDIAWWGLYLRSGLTTALTAARQISDHWIRYPNGAGLGISGSPLFWGGGLIGASLAYAVDGAPTIDNLRPFWNQTAIDSNCNAYDTRDSSYLSSLPALGATLDTGSWQTTFRALVTSVNTRDNACKRSNGGVDTNSWANAFLNDAYTPQVTLTNGSAIGAGTAIPSTLCDGVDIITATVVNGSPNITVTSGSISVSANAIVLGGRYYYLTRTDSTHGSMSALWPGGNGSVSGITRNENFSAPVNALSFCNSGDTLPCQQNYSCIWNNSSQITLDRPFTTISPHTSPDNYGWTVYNVVGYNQQPYMTGIKTFQLLIGALQDSALSINNGSLATAMGTWTHDYGYDSAVTGMYYCRVASFCESGGNGTGTYDSVIPGMKYNPGNINSVVAAEELNAEASYGIEAWYLANPTLSNRIFVDQFCAALWSSQYDSSSIIAYSNPNSVANNLAISNFNNVSLSGGKWSGFGFGFGGFCANTWGALRATNAASNYSTITGKRTLTGTRTRQ